MSDSPVERSAAWSAAGGVFALLGVGAAIPLWLLAKHSGWELALSISSTVALGLGLYCMVAALIPLWPFPLVRGASETRYRIDQRRLFARHVQSQLQILATREDWHDERFADLEAEVEVEGRQRTIPWLRHSPSKTVILRREKSLSRALEHSAEPLIVLEGDPGAGKSVALRHLAERLADKARKSRDISKIPLYINLKEFRPERRPVDSNSVYDFILASVNRVNDRDVERFLDEEFDRGLRDGSWLILLDSFDEIPDILSSTEADNVVEEYALAIHSFLYGMRGSRAIVASREFRGPKTFRVPHFQIVTLSGRRQVNLIRRSGLHPDETRIVEGGLATADPEIRQAATNPMFLGLICEYARTTGRFPESSHSVYESYLTQRFTRDAERMQRRHKVGAKLVRTLAEEIAFSMAAIPGLGLSPTREALHSALINIDQISIARLDAVLDALEYIKLGRAAEDTGGSGRPSFTFAHRRFQEYFATCVVIRDPERVSVTELLADGRWRETAVTILQTQPTDMVASVLEEATHLLAPMTRKALEDEELHAASGGYCWPSGSMHLLGVLNAGLGQAPDNIPAEFRADAGSLLMSAWNRGRRHDKKWAVSLALVARRDDTIWLLEHAFASGSVVLDGAAYACVSRLADPSPGLYKGVQETLVEMAASGDLIEQKVALNAQIRRLPDPVPLIQTLRLLTLAPKIDYTLAAILVLMCTTLNWPTSILQVLFVTVGLMGYQLTLSPQVPHRIQGTRLILRPYSSIEIISELGRLLAATLAVITAINFRPRNWPIVAVALIIGIYFAFWPSTVGYVCRHRRGINEFLWPLIPLFVLVALLQSGIMKIKSGVLQGGKMSVITVSKGLAPILFWAIFVWVLNKYFSGLSHNAILEGIFIAFVVLIVGAMLAGIAFLYISHLRGRHADTQLIHSISSKQKFTVIEVFNILDRIKTPRGMRLVIESILRIDLIAYPEIIRMLSDIAAAAEVAGAQREADAQGENGHAIAVQGATPEFSDWLKGHAENKSRARNRSSIAKLPSAIQYIQGPTIDQIARAIEKIEVARGSTPSQALE